MLTACASLSPRSVLKFRPSSRMKLIDIQKLVCSTILLSAFASSSDRHALLCKVTLSEVEYEPSATDSWQGSEYLCDCNPVEANGEVSQLGYALDLPDNMFDDLFPRLKQGQEVFVSVDGGWLTSDTVVIPTGAVVTEVDPPAYHRRLARPSSTGNVTALILRIITNDAEPDVSSTQLFALTFQDGVSLKKQLEMCSFNKFRLNPTEYGVLDVQIDMNIAGASFRAVVNEAYKSALKLMPAGVTNVRSMADFIMIVLPKGTGAWGAYAAIPGKQSVFNNLWSTYLGATAHEIGHK